MTTPTKPTNALVEAKRDVASFFASDKVKGEIIKVLPKHITSDRMTRVFITSIMRNPDLLRCSQASLLQSLMLCSQAGLEPDGRNAHLIPYGAECKVIFDWKGLVALALRNGMKAVYADVVCENDEFDAGVSNGIKFLKHRINWREPRGEPFLWYASAISANESFDYEVMTLDEVQATKERSRGGKSGPWVSDFVEMGKKCPIRRMSKRWDLLPEIKDVINEDDDTPPPIKGSVTSTPIFKDPKPQIEDAKPTEVTNVDRVRLLVTKSRIYEDQLLSWMAVAGMAKEGDTLDNLDPEVVTNIINSWDEVASNVKDLVKLRKKRTAEQPANPEPEQEEMPI